MKKVCSVVLCTVVMLSHCVLMCCPSLADAAWPVFSLAPEFLRDDTGEFAFHFLPWESTVEETESGLNVSIGEPDFTSPDYLPYVNTRYFRPGDFSFPFLETTVSQMLEYFFVDGKLRCIEATVYRARNMSQDMLYENLMQLYLDALGDPFEQTETVYAAEPNDMLTVMTRWISDPRPDGKVTFLALRGHSRGSMYSIMITVGLTDLSDLVDTEH